MKIIGIELIKEKKKDQPLPLLFFTCFTFTDVPHYCVLSMWGCGWAAGRGGTAVRAAKIIPVVIPTMARSP